jgi:DNA-directed RNA polymerase subunit RPC12/RpoP
MFYTVKTGEPDYFKCACQRCGKHIEFPSNGVGVTIDCPHCGKKTVLGVAKDSPAAGSKKTLLMAVVGLVAVIVVGGALGLGAFLWIQNQKSKEVAMAVTPTAVAPAPKAPKPKPEFEPVTPAVSPVTPLVKPMTYKPPTPEKALSPAAPVETIEDFSVGKIVLQKVQGSSLVYAVGTAKNTVDRQRFGVRIELNLLDEQDRKIGVVSDYVSVVEPHKDWQFKALLMPTQTGVTKVKVADIKEQQ